MRQGGASLQNSPPPMFPTPYVPLSLVVPAPSRGHQRGPERSGGQRRRPSLPIPPPPRCPRPLAGVPGRSAAEVRTGARVFKIPLPL